VLQGWERHGWRVPPRQLYWLWRDRKGIVGNLLSPAANFISLYGLAGWLRSHYIGGSWGLAEWLPSWLTGICVATVAITAAQMGIRAVCVARIYGAAFACGVPLRAWLGNWINSAATVRAVATFAAARLGRRALHWQKTEHQYPGRSALTPLKPRLGELLVRMSCLSAADLEAALLTLPAGMRLGEHLVGQQKIGHTSLYRALSLQNSIPLADGRRPVPSETIRVLPAEVLARWKVLPLEVEAGRLHVATSEVPSVEMTRDLRQAATLEIQFSLLPPPDMDRLSNGSRGVRPLTGRARRWGETEMQDNLAWDLVLTQRGGRETPPAGSVNGCGR
jgi:hypothetical protein